MEKVTFPIYDISLCTVDNISFKNSKIVDVDFANVKMRYANFFNADLQSVKFSEMNLDEADFTNSTFSNVEFDVDYPFVEFLPFNITTVKGLMYKLVPVSE